jgi:hypothetical protein
MNIYTEGVFMPSLYTIKTSIAKTVNLIIAQTWIDVDPEILACEIRALHLLVDQLGVDVNNIIKQMKEQKLKVDEKTLFDSNPVQD